MNWRHWEGQFFDIGGDAVERVAEAEMIDSCYQLREHKKHDRGDPAGVKEGALLQNLRPGGYPVRDQFGDAEADSRLGLDKKLVPQQT